MPRQLSILLCSVMIIAACDKDATPTAQDPGAPAQPGAPVNPAAMANPITGDACALVRLADVAKLVETPEAQLSASNTREGAQAQATTCYIRRADAVIATVSYSDERPEVKTPDELSVLFKRRYKTRTAAEIATMLQAADGARDEVTAPAGALYEEVPDLGQLAAYDATRTVSAAPNDEEHVSYENRLHILHRGVIMTVQVDAFDKQPEKNKAATFALGRAVVAAP